MRVERLADALVAPVRKMLWVLFDAVAFVLLMACANLASLMLLEKVWQILPAILQSSPRQRFWRTREFCATRSKVCDMCSFRQFAAKKRSPARELWNSGASLRVGKRRLTLQSLLFAASRPCQALKVLHGTANTLNLHSKAPQHIDGNHPPVGIEGNHVREHAAKGEGFRGFA